MATCCRQCQDGCDGWTGGWDGGWVGGPARSWWRRLLAVTRRTRVDRSLQPERCGRGVTERPTTKSPSPSRKLLPLGMYRSVISLRLVRYFLGDGNYYDGIASLEQQLVLFVWRRKNSRNSKTHPQSASFNLLCAIIMFHNLF